MFGEKGFGEVDKIGNGFVFGVCPKAGEFETVAGLFGLFAGVSAEFFDMADAGCVGIVFCVGAV